VFDWERWCLTGWGGVCWEVWCLAGRGGV
jgi:hypothetical protein